MWRELGPGARNEKGHRIGEKPKFWDLKTILVGRNFKAGDDGEESELEGWQGIMVCICFGSFRESLMKSIFSRSLSQSERMNKDRCRTLQGVAQM